MCVFVKIFAINFVLFFLVDVSSLSIDTNLGQIEDCFERVALGKSLPLDLVTENKTEISLSDCEKLCLAEKKCESFDYGVGARGNATCHMSSSKTADLQNNNQIVEKNDYDLYTRRPRCELAAPTPLKPNPGGSATSKPISSTTPGYRPFHERPIYQHDKWDHYVYRKYQNRPQQSYVSSTNPNLQYEVQNHRPVYSQLISYSPHNPDRVQEPPQYVLQPHNGDHKLQNFPQTNKNPSFQSGSYDQMDLTNKPDFSQETLYQSNKPHVLNQGYSFQHQTQTEQNSGYQIHAPNKYSNEPISSEETWPPSNKPYLQTTEHSSQYQAQSQEYPGHQTQNSDPNEHLNKPSSSQETWSPSNKPYLQATEHSSQHVTQSQENSGYQSSSPNQYSNEPIPSPSKRPHFQTEDTQYETHTQQNLGHTSDTYNPNQYLNRPISSQETWSSSKRPYLRPNSGDQSYSSNKPNYQTEKDSTQYGTPNLQNPAYYDGNYNQNKPIFVEDQNSYSMNRPLHHNRPQTDRIPGMYNEIPRPISYSNKYDYNNDRYMYNSNKQPFNVVSKPQGSSFDARPHYQNAYAFQRPSEDEVSNHGYHRPSYFSPKFNSSNNIRYKKPYSQNNQYDFDHNEFSGTSPSQYDTIQTNADSIYQNNRYKPSKYRPQKPISQDISTGSGYYTGQSGLNSKPQSNYGYQHSTPSSYRPGFQQSESSGKPNPGYNLNFNDQPATSGYKPGSTYGNKPTEPNVVIISSNYGTNTHVTHKPSEQDENRPDPDSYKPNESDLDNAFDKPTTNNKPTYGIDNTDILQNVYNFHDTTKYGNHKPQPNYGNKDESFGVAQGTIHGPLLIDRPQYSFSQTMRPQYADLSNHWSYSQNNRPQYDHGNDYMTSTKPNRPYYESVSYQNNIYGSSHTNRPHHTITNRPNQQVKPVYDYEKPSATRPIYVQTPGGQVVTSGQVSISSGSSYGRPGVGVITELKPTYTTCYRRVVAGQRVLRGHVQRALPCESLVDCQRACADEARFHCESFNYKLDPSNRGKGLCELTEKPIEHLDLEKDFVEDKEYDFYELDRNSLQPDCALTWPGVPYPSSGFLGGYNRPQNNWQSNHQSGYGQWGSKFEDEERYNRFDTRVQGYNRVGYDSGRYHNNPHVSAVDRKRGHEHDHSYKSTNYAPDERRPIGYDNFVPYQIAGGRSQEENWGRYGGSYGSNQEHGREYKDSYDYWGLGEVDNTQYHESMKYFPKGWDGYPGGVQSYSGSSRGDFDYGSLGRQNWDGGNDVDSYSHSYGGTGHGSQWNYQKNRESSSGPGTGFGQTSEGHVYGGHAGVDNSYGNGPDSFNDGCSSRRRTGAGLGSRAVKLALLVHDVVACEAACFQEVSFMCVSYSFRYSKQETENCFLSELPYKGLDFTSDSGSDVYTMQGSSCRSSSTKPWIESECFWHVRAGRKLTRNAINTGLITSGLGACEAECIRAYNFVCRAFSFRFGSPTIGDDPENCLLTSLGSSELADSWNSLEASEGHELYARGSFGRGCEPTVIEEIAPNNKGEQCYLQYDSSARLLPSAVRYPMFSKDSDSCREACSMARLKFEQSAARAKRSYSHHHTSPPLVRCMSFSFSSDPHVQSNCLLSDIRLIDLQLGLDYEHSNQDWLFAFDLFNKECWSTTIGHGHHHGHTHGDDGYRPEGQFTPVIPRPSLPPITPGPSGPGTVGLEPPHPATAPAFHGPHGHHYRPSEHAIHPISPSGPSNYPFRPLGPEVGIGSVHPSSGAAGYSPHRSQDGYRGHDYFDDEGRGAWSQYTVSGWPCRAGSRCAPNQVTAYWSCELEGGEVGAWDYCCTPEHHCGYSEGFNKPWCYVGPSRDQWRPCNDKYYPYHQASSIRPSQEYPTSDNSHYNPPHSTRPVPTQHYGPSGNVPLLNPRPGSYHDVRPLPSSSADGYQSSESGSPYHGTGYPTNDHKYWDDLYKNGPQSFYDSDGNPRPGYARIPTVDGPRVHYQHNTGPPHSDNPRWVPVPPPRDDDYLDPSSSGFGTPRYWPVAYLHKSSPPNTTYYNHNENTFRPNDRKDKFDEPNFDIDKGKKPNESKQVITIDTTRKTVEQNINENVKNDSDTVKNVADGRIMKEKDGKTQDITKNSMGKVVSTNNTETTTAKTKNRSLEGIDDKLEFSDEDIEVLNLDDAKRTDKKEKSNLEIFNSEERQIEALGRLLASRRDGQIIEKRSQNEFDAKNIQIAFESTTQNDYVARKFVTASDSRPERRGSIQKVYKSGEENNPSSSANTQNKKGYPTSDVIKTQLNGKIFYDASGGTGERNTTLLKEKSKESSDSSAFITQSSADIPFGQRMAKSRGMDGSSNRNMTSSKRGRRYYRRNYNPNEVRKRLLKKQSGEVA